MTADTGRDDDYRELFARIVVIETIQNQLLQRCAALSNAPTAFFTGLMRSCEETLDQVGRQAGPEDAQAAADAIASFRDRSMRLIAALTPQGPKN